MMLLKVRQLNELAAKLDDIANELDGLFATLDCCCEGACDVCRSLAHTSHDVDCVADLARQEAAHLLNISTPRQPAAA